MKYEISRLNFLLGKFDETEHQLLLLIKLAQDEVDFDLSGVRNILGLIFYRRGHLYDAEAQFLLGREIAKVFKNDVMFLKVQNNLAEMQRLIGKFGESEKTLIESIQYAEQRKLNENLEILYCTYGEFLLDKGEFIQSKEYFEKSMQYLDYVELSPKLNTLALYSKYFKYIGDLKQAEQILLNALELAQDHLLMDPKTDIYLLLSELYLDLNENNKSYHFIRKVEEIAWELNSDILKARILIIRSRLNLKLLNFNESEIQLFEAQQYAQKVGLYELEFRIKFLQSELNLIKVLVEINNDKVKDALYEESLMQISAAVALARKIELRPILIDALLIQGTVLSVSDFDKSTEVLKEALNLANECKYDSRIAYLENRLLFIKKQSQESRQNINKEFLLRYYLDDMDRITRGYTCKNFSVKDLESIFLLVYKVDDVMGPELQASYNIDEENPLYFQPIIMNGALYSTVLGSGQSYHEGFFGPFPFGENNLQAMIYSKIIGDTSQKDARSNNSTFSLICLIFKGNLNPLFYNRSILERIFTQNLQKIVDFSEIDKNFTKSLYLQILSEYRKSIT